MPNIRLLAGVPVESLLGRLTRWRILKDVVLGMIDHEQFAGLPVADFPRRLTLRGILKLAGLKVAGNCTSTGLRIELLKRRAARSRILPFAVFIMNFEFQFSGGWIEFL